MKEDQSDEVTQKSGDCEVRISYRAGGGNKLLGGDNL